MMNWWLELYTIPMLKVIFKSWLIACCITLACFFYLPEALYFCAFSNGLLFYSMNKNRKNLLASNIEFHKTHIPLKQLRVAYLKDSSILFVAQSFCYLSIYFFCVQGSTGDSVISLTYLLLFIGLSFQPFLGVLKWQQGKKPNYMMLNDSHKFFLFITYLLLVVLGSLYVMMMLGMGFGIFTMVAPIALSTLISFCYFIYRAVFHQEMRFGTPKVFMKYKAVGMAGAFIVCLIFGVVSHPLTFASWLPSDFRYVAFSFTGPMAPELQVDEAKEFLRNTDADYDLIFSKTADIGKVPVKDLLPKASSRQVFDYVSAASPSKANMIFLLEELNKKEKFNAYDVLSVQTIIKNWPKGQELPKHLVSKFMKKSDLPAEARIPASQATQEN